MATSATCPDCGAFLVLHCLDYKGAPIGSTCDLWVCKRCNKFGIPGKRWAEAA